VTVVDDGTSAGESAVDWAAAEARLRRVPLRVLGTTSETDLARTRHRLREHGAAAEFMTTTPRPDGPVEVAMRCAAGDASLLVAPPTVDPDVLASAPCPVAVVSSTAPGTAVYVGVAPWTGTAVLTAAVDEAALRGVELVAVRAWTDPRVDLGVITRRMLRRWDAATERAGHDLESALSAYRIGYPGVPIRSLVVQDDPAALLPALSAEAGLFVVGRSERGLLARSLSGSPVAELVRAGRCPVLVVPEDVLVRRTLLPARGTRLARLAP